MDKVYTYKHPCGVTVKIYYHTSIEDTVSIENLNLCISDVYENTYRYDGNLLAKTVIEVWDDRRSDIPVNRSETVNGIKRLILGIGDYLGLTYGSQLIQLNHLALKSLRDMSMCFSHEFGHLKARAMGFDKPKSVLRQKWDAIRGIHATEATKVGELVAEDIRLFQGSRLSKDVERTDKYNYVQGNKVQGLKDLYKIWKYSEELIESYTTFYSYVPGVSFTYSDTDFDYISIEFGVVSFLPWVGGQIFCIDRNGVRKKGIFGDYQYIVRF